MRKSNKAKQTPSRTCADCFHFCACHLWVTSISTDVAPQCSAFEPVRYRTLAEIDDLRQMHKGDLAPVVHAAWIRMPFSECNSYCSACKWVWKNKRIRAKYCLSCGAKMDGGENDGSDS